MRRNPVFVKLTEWEHWPAFMFYLPLLPFFFIRSLKAGHPFYYTIANPAILFSGNGTESKFKTLHLLPESLRPISLLVTKKDSVLSIREKLEGLGLGFPLIAKPNIGFRGYLVKKIDSQEALEKYLQHVDEEVIIQEFIPYENELGIFYHRIPGQEKGKITSVTIKKFIKVKGDGQLTLSALIQKDNRAYLYTDIFSLLHQDRLDKVLKKDEELTLSLIGNHSKGTQFINGNHLINEELEAFIDNVCQKMTGWYYGRLDIKYENYKKLLHGEEFKILEINGIISEPTHIYDASHENASYFKALKSINDHWSILGKIAVKNHKEKNISYPSVKDYVKNMLWLRSYNQKLKKLNAQQY